MKNANIKERLKSKQVWIGVIAQGLLITALIIPELTPEIKIIAVAAVEIATTIGFLNNPTDLENF